MIPDDGALLPCPFCGAKDGRLIQAFSRAAGDFAYWSVECLDCACEIVNDESQALADVAWNTRATSPAQVASAPDRAGVDLEALCSTLAWYGEQARLCRLIHSEGDAGRHALDNDGGKRALAALSATPSDSVGGVEG